MKILIDCRFWGEKYTGLGRYTQNLVVNLLRIDKKNNYVLLVKNDNLFDTNALSSARVQLARCNVVHYSLREQLEIPLILNKLRLDLVHFPHFNIPIGYFGKFVVTIHDLIKHYSRGIETTTRNPLIYAGKYLGYKFVFNQAITRSKKILVPSEAIKKEILKFYDIPGDKIIVTYEGVDDKFVIQQKKEEILGKYGIKKPYVIYVGNAYPHKNLRNLILAIRLMNNSNLSIQLVISCARDIFWHRLEKEIKELRAQHLVKLVGFIPDEDLVILYSHAQAFVMPSLMEGFGLPALEAMRVGCPVVCSDISVFKEIYDKAARYFNPINLESMKENIAEVINLNNNARNLLISRGREQVKKYSWEKLAINTLKVYESCFSL